MKIRLENEDLIKVADLVSDKMTTIGTIYNETFDVEVNYLGIGINVFGTYTVTKSQKSHEDYLEIVNVSVDINEVLPCSTIDEFNEVTEIEVSSVYDLETMIENNLFLLLKL